MNTPQQMSLFDCAAQAANEASGHPPSYVPERKGNPFYSSKGWRRARGAVLARDGAQCKNDGRTVADGVRLEVHHIIPISQAPHLALYLSNLEVLCDECHEQKHYRMSLRRPVVHLPALAASSIRK